MATAPTSVPEPYVKMSLPGETLRHDAADRASMEPSETGATSTQNAVASAGLGALILRSSGWIGAARAVTAVGGVLRYIIFARLLRPYDFGVFGAATAAQSLLVGLTDLNLATALVPQKDEIDEFLDTIWTVAVVRTVLVALVLVAAARPLARFFKMDDQYIVFIMYAPLPIVDGLSSPAVSGRILRDLAFRTSLVLNSAELGAGFLCGLGAILFWRNWRGLMVTAYAAQIARTALTYYYYPYRPCFAFDYGRARRLFEFGGWVTARRLADFAARKLDSIAVGHFLGPQVLGEYQFAFRVGELPTFEVAYSIGLVLFSLMRRLDRQRAGRLLLATNVFVAASGIVYTAMMYRWGAPLLELTVGPKWLAALGPLYLLCVSGIFGGLLAVGAFFLDGLNLPASSFKLSLQSAVVLAVLVVPLTMIFGVRGTALAVVASVVIPVPWMLKLEHKAMTGLE